VTARTPAGCSPTRKPSLDQTQAKVAKERFLAALRGTREPVVLGKGWKYQQVQVSPEESQFLATQGYTEAQCARIFGPGFAEVLGYESGGSMTYANVESRSAHLLVYSLNKWFTRLERLLTEMLPRPQYARINRDAMLQSTTLDRYRAHESGAA
jgi:phage portal protein BeeE